MLDQEFQQLVTRVQKRQCEEQIIEVKAAHKGCPDRLYDTFSSFSNQDDGGTILFGLDEKQHFAPVGVYDAQDLQKKLMEIGAAMTPIVRPVLSVFDENGKLFVTAEIPPVDLTERPCYKTAKGRLKGSYLRVGDADKPMTEYEVYSYEAYRKKYRDDIRPVEEATLASLNQDDLDDYIARRKRNRPHFSAIPTDQLNELMNITKNGEVTLSAVLLFCPYPQSFFPQLAIIASRVPGTEMGAVGTDGQRFTDSKRIEGNLMEMLEAAREGNLDQLPLVVSGYRTQEKQQKLYDEKISEYRQQGYSEDEAVAQAQQWVAVPGYSEHQLGLAVDINGTTYDLYLWLQENSYKYGFIFRYPAGKTELTGTAEEVWHYRYVGVEAATEMYERGICLEEYVEDM